MNDMLGTVHQLVPQVEERRAKLEGGKGRIVERELYRAAGG